MEVKSDTYENSPQLSSDDLIVNLELMRALWIYC